MEMVLWKRIDRCKITAVRDTKKLSRADKKVIAKFLDKNYQYGYDSGSKVKEIIHIGCLSRCIPGEMLARQVL